MNIYIPSPPFEKGRGIRGGAKKIIEKGSLFVELFLFSPTVSC